MPNKKTAAQRQPYVDAMKGFGILCVVIGHFIEYHRGTAPGINALFTCIYLFHMAIFCTASGLVAKFSLRKLVTQQLWLYPVSYTHLVGTARQSSFRCGRFQQLGAHQPSDGKGVRRHLGAVHSRHQNL